jgi:uncharacterized protein (DUF362 family)
MNSSSFDRKKLNRRGFLKVTGMVGAGILLNGCQKAGETPASPPAAGTEAPLVALAKAASYDISAVRQAVSGMLEQLGGVGDIVRPGAKVGIKVNLTGGTDMAGIRPELNPVETYATHPAVVMALAELLLDAGASQLYIMDGLASEKTFADWGYTAMAKPLSAQLINLCSPKPYGGFAAAPVGAGHAVYESFVVNGLLTELDAFVSVAKLKCHYVAGVTLSMKNLVGMVPLASYKRSADDVSRTALHGEDVPYMTRLPCVIVDLNLARPIHLALIDGIRTVEAGEGPWLETMQPVAPGLMAAGKCPLAADAVATAAMGFDPAAAGGKTPFVRGDNHLALGHEAGLGPHRLEEIAVVGEALTDVHFPFKACV